VCREKQAEAAVPAAAPEAVGVVAAAVVSAFVDCFAGVVVVSCCVGFGGVGVVLGAVLGATTSGGEFRLGGAGTGGWFSFDLIESWLVDLGDENQAEDVDFASTYHHHRYHHSGLSSGANSLSLLGLLTFPLLFSFRIL
jgi:hypothetical protein